MAWNYRQMKIAMGGFKTAGRDAYANNEATAGRCNEIEWMRADSYRSMAGRMRPRPQARAGQQAGSLSLPGNEDAGAEPPPPQKKSQPKGWRSDRYQREAARFGHGNGDTFWRERIFPPANPPP